MQKNQIIWLVLPLSIYGLVTNILLINGFECSIVSSQVDSVPFSSTLNVFCNDFCSTGKEKGKKWSFHNFWTVSIVLPLTHVIKYLFKLKYMTHCQWKHSPTCSTIYSAEGKVLLLSNLEFLMLHKMGKAYQLGWPLHLGHCCVKQRSWMLSSREDSLIVYQQLWASQASR